MPVSLSFSMQSQFLLKIRNQIARELSRWWEFCVVYQLYSSPFAFAESPLSTFHYCPLVFFFGLDVGIVVSTSLSASFICIQYSCSLVTSPFVSRRNVLRSLSNWCLSESVYYSIIILIIYSGPSIIWTSIIWTSIIWTSFIQTLIIQTNWVLLMYS